MGRPERAAFFVGRGSNGLSWTSRQILLSGRLPSAMVVPLCVREEFGSLNGTKGVARARREKTHERI